MAPTDSKNIPQHQGNIYDPKCPYWKDPMNVMSAFKTFPCSGGGGKARTAATGYCDCTGYHGRKDRRRSFKIYKYFCSPCMYVKPGDEWKEPTLCPYNDNCFNCHTRFEQQFHPEVFKKMKCHDMVLKGECPRGPLCAFAHNREEHPDGRTWNMKPSEYLPENYSATPVNRAPIYPQKSGLSDEATSELDKEKETKTEVSTMKYAPGNPSFAKIAAGNKPAFCSPSGELLDAHFPEVSASLSPKKGESSTSISTTNSSESVKIQSPPKLPKYERTNSNFISIGTINKFSSTRLVPKSDGRERSGSTSSSTNICCKKSESEEAELNNSESNESDNPEMSVTPSSTPMKVLAELSSIPTVNEDKPKEEDDKFDPFKVYEWEDPIKVEIPPPESTVDCRKRTGNEVSLFDLTPLQRILWTGRRSPPPEPHPIPFQQLVDDMTRSWNPYRNLPVLPASTYVPYQLFPPKYPHWKKPPVSASANRNPDDFFHQMETLLRSICAADTTASANDDFFDTFISQQKPLSEFWEKVATPVVTPEILNQSSCIDFPSLPYQSTFILKGLFSKFFPPCQKFIDAWNSHVDLNHSHYPCLICKRRTPEGARKTIFHPCEHQVACISCYINLKDCPLCGCSIIGKTLAPDWPPRSFIRTSSSETQDSSNDTQDLEEGLS